MTIFFNLALLDLQTRFNSMIYNSIIPNRTPSGMQWNGQSPLQPKSAAMSILPKAFLSCLEDLLILGHDAVT